MVVRCAVFVAMDANRSDSKGKKGRSTVVLSRAGINASSGAANADIMQIMQVKGQRWSLDTARQRRVAAAALGGARLVGWCWATRCAAFGGRNRCAESQAQEEAEVNETREIEGGGNAGGQAFCSYCSRRHCKLKLRRVHCAPLPLAGCV